MSRYQVTDSYRRTNYLNKPVVDKAFMGQPRMDEPKSLVALC